MSGRRRARAVMVQGTGSHAGKTVLAAGLCRLLARQGLRVMPFKSQNMSLNAHVAPGGGAMGGAQVEPLPMLRAACASAIRKKPGRTEYQRGIVSRDERGDWRVAITGSQGSGILRSMSEANGLVVLHHEQGSVEAGGAVDVLPFDGLI